MQIAFACRIALIPTLDYKDQKFTKFVFTGVLYTLLSMPDLAFRKESDQIDRLLSEIISSFEQCPSGESLMLWMLLKLEVRFEKIFYEVLEEMKVLDEIKGKFKRLHEKYPEEVSAMEILIKKEMEGWKDGQDRQWVRLELFDPEEEAQISIHNVQKIEKIKKFPTTIDKIELNAMDCCQILDFFDKFNKKFANGILEM